jgi:hypothetical protein
LILIFSAVASCPSDMFAICRGVFAFVLEVGDPWGCCCCC